MMRMPKKFEDKAIEILQAKSKENEILQNCITQMK